MYSVAELHGSVLRRAEKLSSFWECSFLIRVGRTTMRPGYVTLRSVQLCSGDDHDVRHQHHSGSARTWHSVYISGPILVYPGVTLCKFSRGLKMSKGVPFVRVREDLGQVR